MTTSPVVSRRQARVARALHLALALLAGLAPLACEGQRGPAGASAPRPDDSDDDDVVDVDPVDTELDPGEPAPALVLTILGLEGAVDAAAAEGVEPYWEPGNLLAVRFSITQGDGSPWPADELAYGQALVSGPSFNYQRVIPEQDDLLGAAIDHGDGTFSYAFAGGLPDVYAAPLNDSPSFGTFFGELTGEPLLAGTYTLGLFVGWDYTVDGEPFRVGSEATIDFRVGAGAGPLTPRRVTTTDHCNRCHVALEAHEERYHELTSCLLCHTSGAEDQNDPALAGGTPGATIDSRVLFHRIHDGRHLPSVLGIAVTDTGDLDYDAPSVPFVLAGEGGVLHDYSDVGFPAFPNRVLPLPRQTGYSGLSPEAQAKNDEARRGVATCFVCHGDPDGAGPLEVPDQGQLHLVQPSQKVCASCHDDVDFSLPYNGTFGQMPPLEDNAACVSCHDSDDSPLAVGGGHRHPLSNPEFNDGLVVELLALGEGPGSDNDGRLETGETLSLTLSLENDNGQPVNPFLVTAFQARLSGPTQNANLVIDTIIPRAALVQPQPFTLTLPERRLLERVGASTGVLGDVFATTGKPHLDLFEGFTVVSVAGALGPASGALAQPGQAGDNLVDLLAPGGFLRDDVVVIDRGTPSEEYLTVQFVDGARLWFSSPATPEYAPGLRFGHGMGATVEAVALEPKVAGFDYELDAAAGTITEKVEFGDGAAVVVDYTTPFRLPAVYPQPHNASPDLGQPSGSWAGDPIVSGTYRFTLSAYRAKTLAFAGENTPYVIASAPVSAELLVGSATTPEPYALIDDGNACNACHQDIAFHGGRQRGFDACLSCHGNAGAEDRPRYVAAGAPATPGVTVSFRNLLHRIHRGRDLAHADSFTVVGEGDLPYPDNFSVSGFGEVGFPARPGGVRDCARCHGEAGTTWQDPGFVEHPTDQSLPIRSWTTACSGCHDDNPAIAHMDSQTSPLGAEACAICHAPGEDLEVALVHDFR